MRTYLLFFSTLLLFVSFSAPAPATDIGKIEISRSDSSIEIDFSNVDADVLKSDWQLGNVTMMDTAEPYRPILSGGKRLGEISYLPGLFRISLSAVGPVSTKALEQKAPVSANKRPGDPRFSVEHVGATNQVILEIPYIQKGQNVSVSLTQDKVVEMNFNPLIPEGNAAQVTQALNLTSDITWLMAMRKDVSDPWNAYGKPFSLERMGHVFRASPQFFVQMGKRIAELRHLPKATLLSLERAMAAGAADAESMQIEGMPPPPIAPLVATTGFVKHLVVDFAKGVVLMVKTPIEQAMTAESPEEMMRAGGNVAFTGCEISLMARFAPKINASLPKPGSMTLATTNGFTFDVAAASAHGVALSAADVLGQGGLIFMFSQEGATKTSSAGQGKPSRSTRQGDVNTEYINHQVKHANQGSYVRIKTKSGDLLEGTVLRKANGRIELKTANKTFRVRVDRIADLEKILDGPSKWKVWERLPKEQTRVVANRLGQFKQGDRLTFKLRGKPKIEQCVFEEVEGNYLIFRNQAGKKLAVNIHKIERVSNPSGSMWGWVQNTNLRTRLQSLNAGDTVAVQTSGGKILYGKLVRAEAGNLIVKQLNGRTIRIYGDGIDSLLFDNSFLLKATENQALLMQVGEKLKAADPSAYMDFMDLVARHMATP